MVNTDIIFSVIWILIFILVSPIVFVSFDFWAGIRKAKKRSMRITSDGFKRTLAKLARYYNVLLAVTVVDALQMTGIWYLDSYYDHSIPIFPFLALLIACAIGFVEIWSIFESAEAKERRDMRNAMELGAQMIKHINNPSEMAKKFAEYLKESEKKEEKANNEEEKGDENGQE